MSVTEQAGIALFWMLLGAVFYAYLGYPFLLRIVSAAWSREIRKQPIGQFSPRVTLIISAYNEEDVIEQKILNALALDYPRDLLEIAVISDGSTDGTNRIVERYDTQGVILKYYPGRLGKTECLNRTVPQVSGEILIFTDANALFDASAVRRLVENFGDKTIGFVTGYTRYTAAGSSGTEASVNIYTRLEIMKKEYESRLGSCVGADGAIFAIRKHLFRELKAEDINDFVIPLNIVRQGYRGVFEREVFCYEAAQSDEGEYRRQVRITGRTLRALRTNSDLLNPFRHGFFALQLLSNKLIRLMSPFLLSALLFASAMLGVLLQNPFYAAAFACQAVFYLTGWLVPADVRSAVLKKPASISKTFFIANCAIMTGWLQYLKGDIHVRWNTER